jgi:hypothetical protein
MQAPFAPRRPLAFQPGTPMLSPAYAMPAGGLPVFPPAWSVMPSARALVLRHDDGREIHLDGGSPGVDIRRVALMTMGSHRLSVYADSAQCVACWSAAGAQYRMAAPMTLAGFMTLLLSLIWS